MYTEAEKKKLANYAKLRADIRAGTAKPAMPYVCERYACRLARIALRVCEIERDALRRHLGNLVSNYGFLTGDTK